MFKFLGKIFNTNKHQVLVLKTLVEVQTEMLNELRDTLEFKLEVNRNLQNGISIMKDWIVNDQLSDTNSMKRSTEEYRSLMREWEEDQARQTSLYNWRMNK